MDSSIFVDLFKLLVVLVLVLANGFFVMAEFALVSVRRTRIEELIAQGNRMARVVGKALDDPDRFIAATQLGITIASLGLGWIGEPALAHLLQPLIDYLPGPWEEAASHSLAVGFSFAIITFLHVVIGELAPKSIALQNPEGASLFVATPTLWAERLFFPFIVVLNGAGNALLRVAGIEPASGHALVHSAEEIRMLVAASAEVGAIEAQEQEMVEAIFDLGATLARQVMVPRTEMVCVEANTPLDQIILLAADTMLTKFPVYKKDLDHILGILHIQDLVKAMYEKKHDTPVQAMAREALFLPASLRVDSLLQQLRSNRQHLAILLDEYGGTAGLVTIEDLIEELVGDVQDVFDQIEPDIQHLPDGNILLNGLLQIEEVNDAFDLDLHDPNYDTIAGFVMGKLGRIGTVGDKVEVVKGEHRLRFCVERIDGLRIARLRLDVSDAKSEHSEQD